MENDNVQYNGCDITRSEVSEETIRSIVRDARAGQSERFEELFELYHGMVYGLAWKLTGNYDDALDVTQECFLRAYRALRSWKGNSKFSTWLHRIAVNAAIDYIRREVKHHSRRIESGFDDNSDKEFESVCQGVESQTPLLKLEQKELRLRIFNAVNQLKGRQRRCFILRYFADLTIREVALIVGCGEGATKRHIFRARQRLRLLLL